ncbi:MAG TPA: FAD-binding oxidoreductase, partial [Bacteroidales bacterium]|nr:FAD-binding oxidoreductase [Bacteroidales bacterium]
VLIPSNYESGRIFISKGLLKKARKIAEKNIELLKDFINEETPLLGLEPSAILSFKDEYVNLVRGKFKIIAKKIAQNTFMIDEFIANEYEKGYIKRNLFTSNKAYIRLHGHCHQKALISTKPTIKMLEIPINYKVNEIKSGCCGMAGVFGYEKKHYELSMKIGELILFPEINKESKETIIAAPGTSCRQQILAGTGRKAYHPIEILYDALIKN